MASSSLVGVLAVLLTFGCVAVSAKTGVLFSTLQRTLVVDATPKPGDVLMAGEDRLVVTWRLNESLSSAVDSSYETVKISLCYAPESQIDRAWRKTEDDLHRDDTCQFGVTERPYRREEETFEYDVPRSIPTAVYFIRAYAFNSDGRQVAFGQTTDDRKTQNLFQIRGISGRQASIDVAAAVFSAFSVVSLVGFYLFEKRKKTTNN